MSESPAVHAPMSVASPHAPEDAAPRREHTASRGALWSFLGYGGSQVVRLAGNLALTRLLFQEHFALMALVTVFVQGMQMFSDIGVGPNIIQHSRGDDRRFLDTAWTMGVVRGAALWAIACVGAAPFAAFYEDPRLALILPISGVTALLAGLNSTKLFTKVRQLDLKRFVAIDLASQVVGAVCMIAWALASRSVWALVSGGIAAALTKCLLSHFALPGRTNRPVWDKEAARAIFTFGAWIFLSTCLSFLDRQAHTLVFGKTIPLALLGVYSIGAMLAQMPAMSLGHLCLNVLFPLFSRMKNRGEAVAPVFHRARFTLLVVSGWALAGFVAGGQDAIDLLYRSEWAAAGWILSLLSVGAWFAILESTNGTALLSQGRADLVAASGATKVLAMVVLIPLGFVYGGFPGAVVGYAGTEVFKWLTSAVCVARLGFSAWRSDLALTAGLGLSALAGRLASDFVRTGGEGYGWTVLGALAVFVVVTALWTPLALGTRRRRMNEGRSLFGEPLAGGAR